MKVCKNSRGFTLVEILIVAGLISLFAAMAMISIQSQFRQNLKKTVIAETRQLATAYSWVNQDTGIYPKTCFVSQHLAELSRYLDMDKGRQVSGFEYNGNPISGPVGTRIANTWNGPYFASSATRSTLAQGRRGNCRVRFAIAGQTYIFQAPSDPYPNQWGIPAGSPYVLYLLKIKRDEGGEVEYWQDENGQLRPVYEFTSSATDQPDLIAVVSYGPNGVPGGPEVIPDDAEFERRKDLRLFTESGDRERADYDLPPRPWFRDDPNNERAMAYFDLVTAKDSDDIIFEF